MDFNKVIQELEECMIPVEVVEPINKSENLKEKLLKTLWRETELLSERKDLTLKSSKTASITRSVSGSTLSTPITPEIRAFISST